MFYSFNSGGTMYDFEGFTLDWYKELFGDTRLLIIVLNTLVIALLSAVNFHDYWCDWSYWQSSHVKRRKTKNTLLSLNNVLIVSPDVIIGASFLILFTMAGH